jgi:hypothetical protein
MMSSKYNLQWQIKQNRRKVHNELVKRGLLAKQQREEAEKAKAQAQRLAYEIARAQTVKPNVK